MSHAGAVLGVSCFFHDAAACALTPDATGAPVVRVALAEERLSRVKHDAGFPRRAIELCLDACRLSPGDVACVAFHEKPWLRAERAVASLVASWPRGLVSFATGLGRTLGARGALLDGLRELGVTAPVRYVPHHVSHAADAFFGSPFDEAAVLVIDGVGERATTSLAHGRGSRLTLVEQVEYPHSLGLFYAMITAHLGFRVNHDEAKVMALAASGEPRMRAALEEVLRAAPDGGFALDLSYCAFPYARDHMASPRLSGLIGPARRPDDPLTDHHRDLAASLQRLTEDRVIALARRVIERTGSRRLCLAGGVALNGVANGRVARELGLDGVHVSFAPGDDGACLGAARYVAHRTLGMPRGDNPRTFAALGTTITEEEARTALDEAGLVHQRYDPAALAEEVAGLLAEGVLVGVARGAMEFGPRALGFRSILADARDARVRDDLNRRVKERYNFQPFAPAVPLERVGEWFECDHAVPWMSEVHRVRESVRARIPAVVHTDGTARVQTVEARDHEWFHALLTAFGARTGVPVLLNTSFNARDEPIVRTAAEAVGTFLRTGLDALVVGDRLARRAR